MKSPFKNLTRLDWIFIGALILLSAIAAHSLLQEGHPRIGDCWAHLARTGVVVDALKSFQIPYWDFRIYYGYPFLKFYAPLYYYIAAIFGLISGDLVFGTKLMLFLAHILSALGMFFFVRKYLEDSRAAFIAGLAYAFTFWHLFHIIAMARYPAALIYLMAPLCFLATVRYIEFQTMRQATGLGIMFGLVLLIHPQYGAFTIFFSSLLVLPYLKTLKARPALWILLAGAAVSGFSIIPFLLESGRYLNPFSSENYYNVSLIAILERAKYINRFNNWYLGEYIGISIVALAIAGMVGIIKISLQKHVSLIVGLSFCVLFAFGLAIPNFEWFYRLFGMIPKRFLVFLVGFLSILAAIGYRYLANLAKRPWLIFAIAATFILLDLLPTSFQTRWYPPKDVVMKKRDKIYATIQPGYYLADLGRADTSMFENARLMYPGMQSLYSQNPSPFGYYFQFAPKTTYYSYPWLNIVANSLGMEISDSLKALDDKIAQLLTIRYVALEVSQPRSETDTTLELKTVVTGTISNLNPIIISQSIRPWPESPIITSGQYCFAGDFKELLDSTYIDLDLSIARNLWVRNSPAQDIEYFAPGRPIVRQYGLGINQAEMVVETGSECFARIPFSYYPDIKIYVNGERSVDIYESADHFIVVKLTEGLNIINIVPSRSWVEIGATLLSIICGVAALVGFWRGK
jgi:uncharacterized membrane protein